MLESDSIRMESLILNLQKTKNKNSDSNIINLIPSLKTYLDIGMCIRTIYNMHSSKQNRGNHDCIFPMPKNIKPLIVLSDWNRLQMQPIYRMARYLDKVQSQDMIDATWPLTLNTIAQLFVPSFEKFYDKTKQKI